MSVVLLAVDRSLRTYDISVPDNLHARRLRTQVLIIRRLIVGAAVVITLGAVLLSLPGVQALGASVLASAGRSASWPGSRRSRPSVNVFAGVQLAFLTPSASTTS